MNTIELVLILMLLNFFFFQFYAKPVDFWKDFFNIFDLVVLAISVVEIGLIFHRVPETASDLLGIVTS